MPRRTIEADGGRWEVSPTGRVTQYTRDEFGVRFTAGAGAGRVVRIARYAPVGARSPEASLAELTDAQLVELLSRSQPGWTAPETGYAR
jgi:hypothetical protein